MNYSFVNYLKQERIHLLLLHIFRNFYFPNLQNIFFLTKEYSYRICFLDFSKLKDKVDNVL